MGSIRKGLASSISVAGEAVVVVAGPINGGYIVNPASAVTQGLSTPENLYVDPLCAPGSTDDVAHGTATVLAPGQDYALPPLEVGDVVRANAASAGHSFTVVVW